MGGSGIPYGNMLRGYEENSIGAYGDILLKYKNSGSDCINGALQYYLDIINIFTNSFGNDD